MNVFGVAPDVDLALMQKDQTLAGLTSRAIEGLDCYLNTEKPDAVMVQGDTTTVFCAALTAFYHHIPVVHVEAGLRTGNLESPWPEEGNRQLTTRLTKWHFAPTESNRQNLLREGVPDKLIHVVGNTVIDALLFARDKITKEPPKIPGLPGDNFDFMENRRMVLITGHRRENFGNGFENICHAIYQLARQFPQTQFIYPVHLNPHVQKPVNQILRVGHHDALSNIYLIAPQSYLSFVALMNRATLVLSDSGGVQEEAPSLGKPVLVMRDTTERPEAVAAGTAKLVGADEVSIVREATRLLDDSPSFDSMVGKGNPFGDGHATARILSILAQEPMR